MEMIVNRSSALKVLVATVLLTGLFYFGVRYDVQNTLRQILTWIRGLGAIGPLVFAAIYVLAAVALLPGLILTTGGFWCRQPGGLAIMGYGASQN